MLVLMIVRTAGKNAVDQMNDRIKEIVARKRAWSARTNATANRKKYETVLEVIRVSESMAMMTKRMTNFKIAP